MGKLQVELDKLVADAKDSWADRTVTVAELKRLLVDLVAIANDLKDEPDAEQQVADAMGKVYDTLIAPIDIPNVPAFVESWIDSGIKTAGRAAIHELFAQFKTA